MNPKLVIPALFLLVLPAFSASGEPAANTVSADTAGTYTVREGDTLWDISGARLGNPFSWRVLWEKNGFIRNPDLIFPGQKITLDRGLSESAGPVTTPVPEAPPAVEDTTASVTPDVPSAPVARAIPSAPPDTANVLRMLSAPRPVFTAKNHMRTGFIAKRSAIPTSRIVRLEDAAVGAIPHDVVVVDLGTGSGAEPGDLLAVAALGARVKHPDTGRDYGFVVRIKGMVKVLSVDGKAARCTVKETFDPIEAGDTVMPYTPGSGPLFDAWVRPAAAISGVILAVDDPMISIHTDDILYIDKGERDGVRSGDMFTVYRRVKAGEADNHTVLGTLEAVTVMPGETAVLVTSLKGESLAVGDRVELSARCRVVGK